MSSPTSTSNASRAGVKDSSGDWNHTRAMIEPFGPRGLNMLAGNENFLRATLRAGGAGCITAMGNVNPGPIVQLYQTWQAADADAQQASLDATRAAFTQFPRIAAMKAAIAPNSKRRWHALSAPGARGASSRAAFLRAISPEPRP